MLPPVLAMMIFIAFLAMIFGGIAFALPIMKATSDRIAGRIGTSDAGPVSTRDVARLQEAVQDLERQLHTLQEQHRFLEELIAGRKPDALPSGERAEPEGVERREHRGRTSSGEFA